MHNLYSGANNLNTLDTLRKYISNNGIHKILVLPL